MTKKCCKIDTCGDTISAQCVIYSGTFVDGTYINIEDCDPRVSQVIEEVDRILKELGDDNGVTKSLLTQYNCDLPFITTLITNTSSTKTKTADTIIALLRTICSLQSRISTLETADIYDIELPQEIQLLLATKLDCLDVDPCNPSTLTLKDLLTKIIIKLCP